MAFVPRFIGEQEPTEDWMRAHGLVRATGARTDPEARYYTRADRPRGVTVYRVGAAPTRASEDACYPFLVHVAAVFEYGGSAWLVGVSYEPRRRVMLPLRWDYTAGAWQIVDAHELMAFESALAVWLTSLGWPAELEPAA